MIAPPNAWKNIVTGIILSMCWVAFVLMFWSVPHWTLNWSYWTEMWNSLEVDPPALTALLISLRNDSVLLVLTISVLTLSASLAVVWLLRPNCLRPFFTLLLIALPLLGMWFVVDAAFYAPRRQLAHILEIEALPSYEKFPDYINTARRQSAHVDERRSALYSLQVMCTLEKVKLSPPAEIGRDSSAVVVGEYLKVCRNEEEPLRLQYFAASMLLHKYLRGMLREFPRNDEGDSEMAETLVADVFLKTVAAGGPKSLGLSGYEAYRPGEWAATQFPYLIANARVLQRVMELTSEEDAVIRAEATGALGALETRQYRSAQLKRLQLLQSDEDESVRAAAERGIESIESRSGVAPGE